MDLDEKPAGVLPHEPVGDFELGQLWTEWVNGGKVTAECVVVGLGRYHVALAVLSTSCRQLESEGIAVGNVVRRNRNKVWNYWRQIA